MAGSARRMAVGGMTAALGVVIMSMGALIPFATYCCPLLAMALLIPVLGICGRRVAWAWYGAVAILSCLLCPDPEAAAMFVALGYYPILRQTLNRVRIPVLRFVLKLAVFNIALLLMYGALIFVLGLEDIAGSILEEALWINILTLILGNVTFLMADLLLARFSAVFAAKKR